ncbi:MAG TPA: YigZ family protein [Bacteroidia bacterium]|nr:YigZ family protein [Bacteroidia bacterium]
MHFTDTYLSVERESEAQYRDRGSRFQAYVFPVNSLAQIKHKIEFLKKEHPAAVHYCYAWRLGADKKLFRANDDGEPAGSAGKPIFSQILSRDLSDVLVVVVRYFGGSLLGVPGLIKAYKTSASLALDQNKIVERHVLESFRVCFDESDLGELSQVLRQLDAEVTARDYQERYIWTFSLRKSKVPLLEAKKASLYKTEFEHIQNHDT